MKALKFLAAGLLFICTQAFASTVPYTWTDTYNPTPDVAVSPGHSFSFNFDITDGPNGFRPGMDLVTGYDVDVNLYRPCYCNNNRPAVALVDLPGVIGDRVFFNLSGAEEGGWSLAGWLQLNLTGTLNMTVSSLLGNFFFGDATLTASGQRAVSEPGTLMLLGLSLLAAVGAARRRIR